MTDSPVPGKELDDAAVMRGNAFSRSRLRRLAVQKGEPMPTFDRDDAAALVETLYRKLEPPAVRTAIDRLLFDQIVRPVIANALRTAREQGRQEMAETMARMATLLREGIGRHIGYTVTAAEWRAKAAHALEDHAALLEKEQPR